METNTFGNELLKLETKNDKIIYLFKVFGIKEEYFERFKFKMLKSLSIIEDFEINKNFSIENLQMLYISLAEYHAHHFENGLNLSTYPENSFLYNEIKKLIETKSDELNSIQAKYLFLLFPSSTIVFDYLIETNFFEIKFNKEKITEFMKKYNFFQKLTLQKWIKLKKSEHILYSAVESLRLLMEYGDISLFSPKDKELFIQKLKQVPNLFDKYTKENILTKYLTYQELFEIIEINKGLLFNESFMNSNYGEIIKNDVRYIEKLKLDNMEGILTIWPNVKNDIVFALKMGEKDIDSLHYFEHFKEDKRIQSLIVNAFFKGELGSTYQDY